MSLSTTIQMLFQALMKPKQNIHIDTIPQGRVIDIGGGGEGVIAQAGGARVVAVDKLFSEIMEARDNAKDALWLTADATALPFDNERFDNATAFFSCMYMPEAVKEKVFADARRVLKPGGEFWIWDVPMRANGKVIAIFLQAHLPNGKKVNTGYGVRAKDQSIERFGQLLQAAGFEWQVAEKQKHWFLIKAK